MPIPSPLEGKNLCEACKGTGADIEKTILRDKRYPSTGGYISCNVCRGNGRDPTSHYSWDWDKCMREGGK